MRYSYLIARPVQEYIQQSYKELYLQMPEHIQKEMLWQSMPPSSAARLIKKLPSSLVPLGKEDIELDSAQALFNWMVFSEQPEKSAGYLAMFESRVKAYRPDLYKDKLLKIRKYRERPGDMPLEEIVLLGKMNERSGISYMQEQIIRYRFGIQVCPVWEDPSLKKGISRLYKKLESMLFLPEGKLVSWLTKTVNKGFNENTFDGRGDLSYCSLVKLQYFLSSEGIYENISQDSSLTETEVKDAVDRVFQGIVTSYLVDINGDFEDGLPGEGSSGPKAKKVFDIYMDSAKRTKAPQMEKSFGFPNRNLINGYIKKDDEQLIFEAVMHALAFLSLQARHRKAIVSYLDAMTKKIIVKGDEKLSEARSQIGAMSEENRALKTENAVLRKKTERDRAEKDSLKKIIEAPLIDEINRLKRELKKERARAQEAEDRWSALKEKLDKEDRKPGPENAGRQEENIPSEAIEQIKTGRYIFICDQEQVQAKLLVNFPNSSIGTRTKLELAQLNAADALVILINQTSHSEVERAENIARYTSVRIVYCPNNNIDLIAAKIWEALDTGDDKDL